MLHTHSAHTFSILFPPTHTARTHTTFQQRYLLNNRLQVFAYQNVEHSNTHQWRLETYMYIKELRIHGK